MKRKTIILLIVGILIAVVVGAFIYFVSGVSAVSDPIKKYKYTGDVDKFITTLKKYNLAHKNITLELTDTIGSKRSDYYAVYMTVGMKKNSDSITYRIMCEKENGKSEVHLILAFDETTKTGGYRANAKGVQPLVDYFDSYFLTPMEKSEALKITPQQ